MDKKFRAWLSGGFESPANRFELTALSGIPYVQLNGTIVADSFAELVDDGPRTGISVTETGEMLVQEKPGRPALSLPPTTPAPVEASGRWTLQSTSS